MFLGLVFLAFGVLAWVAVGVLLCLRRKTLAKTEAMRRVDTAAAADATGAAPVPSSRSRATCAARARSRARWPGRGGPTTSPG